MANSLLIEIGANIARMQSDMTKAHQSVKGFADNATRSLNMLKSAFAAIGGTYAIQGMVRGLFDAGVTAERMGLQLRAATGSINAAADAQQFLRKEAERLGLVFDDQVDGFVKIAAAAKGTALEGQAVKDIWLSVAQAGAALQMSSADVSGALTAVSQMISKGKVSAEELRQQLGERLPGAFQIAAKAMGVTTAQLDDMLKKGQVIADDFLPKFATALKDQYGEAAVAAADSAQAALNRLLNEWRELSRELGTNFLPIAANVITKLREWTQAFNDLVGASESGMTRMVRENLEAQLQEAKDLETKFLGVTTGSGFADKALGWLPGYITQEEAEEGLRIQRARIRVISGSLERMRMEADVRAGRYDRGTGLTLPAPLSTGGGAVVDPKKAAKEQADAYKQMISEVEALEAQAEARRMGREYANYQKQMEIEDKALEERLKGYRELAEEEEKIWNAQIKEYEERTEEMSQTTKDFAENSKWTMSEFFFDAMSNDLKSFGDYWEAFWTRMKNSLARTFADMAVEWGMSGIKNILTGGGGGSLLGTIGGALGGAWGSISGGVSSALNWIGSIFHEGGVVGQDRFNKLAQNEVIAILERGEVVLTRDQARGLAYLLGGGGTGGMGGAPGIAGPAGFGFAGATPAIGMAVGMGTIGLTAALGPVGALIGLGLSALGFPTGFTGVGKGIFGAIGQSLGWGGMSTQAAMDVLAGTGAMGGSTPYGGMSVQAAMDMLGGAYGGFGGGSYGGAGYGGGADAYGGPGYATGGIVPRNQIAKVHQGEGVFTPEQLDRLSVNTRQPITVTVPVYIDGRMVSETVYDGIYDASRRRRVTLHPRGVSGYMETAGLDI